MEINLKLKTLTPIWTGGIEKTCDRIHETGVIGSLRWWYEAIVRGLGGYACDPTSDQRCIYDPEKGEKSICAACYLFGCTGWARLFKLHTKENVNQKHPLHFYSDLKLNRSWLASIFDPRHGGDSKSSSLNGLYVNFGNFFISLVFRGVGYKDATSQLGLLFRFISDNAGFGGKLQHGFGIISFDDLSAFPPSGKKSLVNDIQVKRFKNEKFNETLPNLQRFLIKEYSLDLNQIIKDDKRVGKKPPSNIHYIPCVFDLRYKGRGKFGFRRFLEKEKGWNTQIERLNSLMGASAKKGNQLEEEQRKGCSVYFGMPHYISDKSSYIMRIYGVLPYPETTAEIGQLIDEYMTTIGATLIDTRYGIDVLEEV